jgi:quercetin dioxygenase-like cupin family protein
MKLRHSGEVQAKPVPDQGASGVTVRWLITRAEGAPNFAMRLFELSPGGYTPLHQHPWEHEAYILEGEVEVTSEAEPRTAKTGDAILVQSRERHQFRNTGASLARFLCIIPLPPEA